MIPLGPPGLLSTWDSDARGTQWSPKKVHQRSKKPSIHLLPNVQANAYKVEPRDYALQSNKRSDTGHVC